MFGVNDHTTSCGTYCGGKRANPIASKGSSRKIGGRDMWRVRARGREIFSSGVPVATIGKG